MSWPAVPISGTGSVLHLRAGSLVGTVAAGLAPMPTTDDAVPKDATSMSHTQCDAGPISLRDPNRRKSYLP